MDGESAAYGQPGNNVRANERTMRAAIDGRSILGTVLATLVGNRTGKLSAGRG